MFHCVPLRFSHAKGYTLENERVNIALPARERELLGQLCELRGMTLRSFITRVVRWIANLDPAEQAIVLDQISRGERAEIAALVLARSRAEDLDAVVRQLALVRAALAAAPPGTPAPAPKGEKRRA